MIARVRPGRCGRSAPRGRSGWPSQAGVRHRLAGPGRRGPLKSAEIALEKVEEEMRVLDEVHQNPRVGQGPAEQDRRGRAGAGPRQAQAKAKEVQAEADRKTKKSIYEQEQLKYEDIEEEIKKCMITAPQDGLVVYYVSEQSRYGCGSQQSIIAQGEPVREGQKLMRIPDLTQDARQHQGPRGDDLARPRREWQHDRLRRRRPGGPVDAPDAVVALLAGSAFERHPRAVPRATSTSSMTLADGLPAQVRVDAFPDRVLNGHVKTVATVASQQDWMLADVKVYQTMVSIDESVRGPEARHERRGDHLHRQRARQRAWPCRCRRSSARVDMGDTAQGATSHDGRRARASARSSSA